MCIKKLIITDCATSGYIQMGINLINLIMVDPLQINLPTPLLCSEAYSKH